MVVLARSMKRARYGLRRSGQQFHRAVHRRFARNPIGVKPSPSDNRNLLMIMETVQSSENPIKG
jgi:hypothetical protein